MLMPQFVIIAITTKPGALSIYPKFPVCHSGKFPVQMERPFHSQE